MNGLRFWNVWDENGEVQVVEEDGDSIDGAVQRFKDSGGKVDETLLLTTLAGGIYRTNASGITGWLLSTPATRLRSIELQKELDAEREGFRRELGIWEPEEI